MSILIATVTAYLLNGLTDQGYWYQVGLAYDWPVSLNGGGYDPGWTMLYAVGNSAGTLFLHQDVPINGAVNEGDTVLLQLSFSNGNVLMVLKDVSPWGSGTASESYSAESASTFIGLATNLNSNGYFSGPMTEMYRVNYYTGDMLREPHYNFTTIISNPAFVSLQELPVSSPDCNLGFCLYQEESFAGQLTTLQAYNANGEHTATDATCS